MRLARAFRELLAVSPDANSRRPKLRRQVGDLPWLAPDLYSAEALSKWVEPRKLLRGIKLRAASAVVAGAVGVTASVPLFGLTSTPLVVLILAAGAVLLGVGLYRLRWAVLEGAKMIDEALLDEFE